MKLLQSSDWGGSSEHGASVQKILDGTLRAMRTIGARRLSMSDISDAGGVSRGTLYRYFASKEDVLAAVSEHVCDSFERGIIEAGAAHADPVERFRAVMRFYARFTIERSPEGFFEVEPAFHLNFLRTHFARHKAAVRIAINASLDHFETLTCSTVDRDAFVDTLVRLQLSTLIVPATPEWIELWNQSPDRLLEWALRLAGKQERTN
ncbi:TetR/AcrR family transcriptional regulator [Sphingomonas solaris]|uniref:TetR/AcrR family transcriptional regulator n=1 Tax=Alterirhizorhabdus solaris TaxID=2529389 RepID=A0A558RCQ2_9SPHN|nr:TetR/AcrR family transcriptional regulator [Sphingomonas solaris]TVV77101.1 TetR/AcrR family transcriptional regulator [Sphingomonas solaris]